MDNLGPTFSTYSQLLGGGRGVTPPTHTPKVRPCLDSVIESKANPKNLEEIKQETQADSEMQVLVQLREQGWPKYKKDTSREVQELYEIHDKLSVAEGLVVLES